MDLRNPIHTSKPDMLTALGCACRVQTNAMKSVSVALFHYTQHSTWLTCQGLGVCVAMMSLHRHAETETPGVGGGGTVL